MQPVPSDCSPPRSLMRIILDLGLPDRSGLELIGEIRSVDGTDRGAIGAS